MKPTIPKSNRTVSLRPIELSDISRGWLEWMQDEEVTRHLSVRGPVSPESLQKYYEASQPPNAAMFAIIHKATDTYIGNARLSSIDPYHRKASYGWLIGNRAYRGRGLGTEALRQLLAYAFESLNLNRVSTSVSIENQPSLRVQEKVGMRIEGTLREYIWNGERFIDAVQFSILRKEFLCMKPR